MGRRSGRRLPLDRLGHVLVLVLPLLPAVPAPGHDQDHRTEQNGGQQFTHRRPPGTPKAGRTRRPAFGCVGIRATPGGTHGTDLLGAPAGVVVVAGFAPPVDLPLSSQPTEAPRAAT